MGCPANGTFGTSYSSAVSISGGTPPDTVYGAFDPLPPGLSLNSSTGAITGVLNRPGTLGSYTIGFFKEDSTFTPFFATCTITIALGVFAIFPFGYVGFTYEGWLDNTIYDPPNRTVFNAGGGSPPYTFSIVSGGLPPGLSLNSSTGAVTGTPTTAGSYSYTVQVTDSLGATATASGSIEIDGPDVSVTGDVQALNLFDFGRLWRSHRTAPGTWATESLLFQATTPSDSFSMVSSGAVHAGQGSHMGVVGDFTSYDGNYKFLENGYPFTRTNIPVPSGYSQIINMLFQHWERSTGAFYYNSTYWAFFRARKFSGSNFKDYVVCLNSTDGGSTWSNSLDDSNAPEIFDSTLVGGLANENGSFEGLNWDGTSSTVDVFVSSPGSGGAGNSHGVLFTFDMSGAGAWSAPSTDFTPSGKIATNGIAAGMVVKFSNGDRGVFYGHGSGVWYNLLSSGSWAGEVQLLSSPNQLACVALDSSNIVHMMVYSTGSVGAPTVTYYQVQQNGTLSSLLFTFPSISNSDGVGRMIISSDNYIVVPLDDFSDHANAVWEAPLAGPYTFTKSLIPASPVETYMFSIDSGWTVSCTALFYGLSSGPPPGPLASFIPRYIKGRVGPAN